MKRILILAIPLLFCMNVFSQHGKTKKTKKPKPVAIEKIRKEHLPASKHIETVKTKKGTTTKTIYLVENDYKQFEDGIYAEFDTDSGRIIAKLYFDKVPMTVCNFVGLAEGTLPNSFRKQGQPYYDSLKFHRVITKANGDNQDFMIQGGDPKGDGSGGPGYQFEDEFNADLLHEGPGILSMANAGPGTNGSQFFITVTSTHWLDFRHSIFGKVVQGVDVLSKVRTNTLMKQVRIIRKGDAALDFKTDSATFETLRASARKEKDFATDSAEVLKRYPNAKRTASGLWYVIKEEGKGPQVKEGSQLQLNIIGKLPNGREFDNSYKTGAPLSIVSGQIQSIPGLDEGLALMREGSKGSLIIPSSLAFGTHGAGSEIPASSTLIFDVEVISVKEPDKTLDFATSAEEVLKRYPTAKQTASGLWYVVEKEGDGIQAMPGMNVKVHYKGTFANGEGFDSSYGGEPLPFQLGQRKVIAAWEEGIAMMKVGSKYKLIVPSKLGYGSRGYGGVIPPNASLIFDVELVEAK